MKVLIRKENSSDFEAIKLVNDLAFGQEAESKLIDALRKNKEFKQAISLVACLDNEVLGHILFFPLEIEENYKRYATIGLAPMSVLPEFQGLGIGSQLVQDGLKKCRKAGFTSCVVLGHANFYPKFGFKPSTEFGIRPAFGADKNYYMAIELKPGTLQFKNANVLYPGAFDEE